MKISDILDIGYTNSDLGFDGASCAVLNAIGPYTTNVQNSFFNTNYAYLASTGIPNYNIGHYGAIPFYV